VRGGGEKTLNKMVQLMGTTKKEKKKIFLKIKMYEGALPGGQRNMGIQNRVQLQTHSGENGTGLKKKPNGFRGGITKENGKSSHLSKKKDWRGTYSLPFERDGSQKTEGGGGTTAR